MKQAKLYFDGSWQDGARTTELCDKFDGRVLAHVHEANQEQVETALASLDHAWQQSSWTKYDRYQVLSHAAALLTARADEMVSTIVDDTGFTIADARREVERATQTLTISAEEAKRIHGEMVPLDGAPGAAGRLAFTVRHPVGVVCAITPFNSPLNTVIHKVAPALAAGNAVVLKPSSLTPLSAAFLVDILLQSGLPEHAIALVYGGGSTVGQRLLESPVPSFYAFTGSTEVGERITRTVGLRRTQLELGSLSSTIVCNDASVEHAISACTGAAFRKAGQVCTSVQRLYVQSGILDEFVQALSAEVGSRAHGDPRVNETMTGPVISRGDADRIERWIGSAVDGGAELVTGGERAGQVIAPTVLGGVDSTMEVMRHEVFGPVVSVVPFSDLSSAIDDVNDTPYGLAAGIFTADISHALDAADGLRMGTVHINETSSSRVDLMPYGGVKDSGMGVEGPRYAIEEMTEQRLVTVGRP